MSGSMRSSSRSPARTVAAAADIANAVLYLASDLSPPARTSAATAA
ncbi:hypothetical protein [Amycolatopsis saalfeldensis]|nr:hypothetical protein [Amycolatopsis saalfeldensis]